MGATREVYVVNTLAHRSRPAGTALVLSLLICGGLWVFTQRLRPVVWAGAPELATLAQEHAALRGNDEAACAEWRRRAGQQATVPAAGLAALQASLAPDWRWEVIPSIGGAGQGIRLTARSQDLHQWPVVLATLRKIESLPGATVSSLELTAVGTGKDRHFSRLILEVRFNPGIPGNAERGAALFPRSPLRATEVGPTRKGRALCSRRRPTACGVRAARLPQPARPFQPGP
jgi:hypothetical protein